MNKFNYLDKGGNFGNIDSLYEEVASFSGDEIDMVAISGIKSSGVKGKIPDTSSIHNINNINNGCGSRKDRIRVHLYGSNDYCHHLRNGLILDNLGDKYSFIKDSATFDGKYFNPNFNSSGVITKVYTRNSKKVLDLLLSNTSNSDHSSNNYSSSGNNFKLSQIMNNIGNINKLNKSNYNEMADINIKQTMNVFARCYKVYVIFNFDLYNVGNNVAQKILFKDVIPNNIYINHNTIFVNGNRVKLDRLFLRKNKCVINLSDLKEGKHCNITIAGRLCSPMLESNFAIISYVGNSFNFHHNTVTNISQKLSNLKKI